MAISHKQATAVRAAIMAHYRVGPDDTAPKLERPGDWLDWDYALTWDAGPDNWTVLATSGGVNEVTGADIAPATLPDGVFCEAVNGSVLGLYEP